LIMVVILITVLLQNNMSSECSITFFIPLPKLNILTPTLSSSLDVCRLSYLTFATKSS